MTAIPSHSRLTKKSKSHIYVTTDGVSASLSWCEAPSGAQGQIFVNVRQLRFLRGAPSLTRGRVCHLQLLLAFAGTVILGSEPRGTRDHILLSQIRDSSKLGGGGPVPVFIPQEQGGATVEVFDSSWFSLYSLGTDRIENVVSNNSFFVSWIFVTAEMCLTRRVNVLFCCCLAAGGFSC
jgi:hypothetical protein